MIFPKVIKPTENIGICAPSAGVGEDIVSFEASLEQLKKAGFALVETNNVRSVTAPSAPAKVRAEELMQLWKDEKVGFILSASGGDFLEEILPFLDWERIKKRPLWVQGYSDNTGLLFPLTTVCDIATIYGPNAGGYDMSVLHPSLEISLDFIKGNFREQASYEKYQSGWGDGVDGFCLDTLVQYELPNGDIDVTGRVLGGCLDILRDLKGTPYEDVRGFVNRYREDGLD